MLRYKLIASDGHTMLCSNKLGNVLDVAETGACVLDTYKQKVIIFVDEDRRLIWVEK